MEPKAGLRVGVDVGGTFTKAVAVDPRTGAIAARAVVATTHDHPDGVSAGVVEVVAELAAQVGAAAIELVTHSTTQAVNAMLEGDAAPVGVIGIGRAPDVRKSRKRTAIKSCAAHEFLDVTAGLDPAEVRAALRRLAEAGARAVCVAEAFAPDDATGDRTVAELAVEAGLPVTTSAELSGLYGLELRTVTAALNASILPIALHTAQVVEAGVAAARVSAPVMVMRGDGGATDLAGFRAGPARTLYSGPAASVAGALRAMRVADGVIVEVGGTSTNVAAIRDGRPLLSYVTVASHATALRALDVRVVGVAGGSMLRVRKRRVHAVGPRSAHIAGLPYACFLDPQRLAGAQGIVIAPRNGDEPDHLALQLTDGTRAAVTVTCAANSLGITEPGDHAWTDTSHHAGVAALTAAGHFCGIEGRVVAERMLAAASEAVCELVYRLIATQKLRSPVILAVGGAAGGLGRFVANRMGLPCTVPPEAEIISSIGDALSMVRAERERTVSTLTADVVRQLSDEAENEALAAGASPGSVEVRIEELPERGTVRAIATGTVGLRSGALPGQEVVTAEAIRAREPADAEVTQAGAFWLVSRRGHIAIVDRFGDPVATVKGVQCTIAELDATVERLTRIRGPVTLRPTIWSISGGRIAELASTDMIAAATALHDPNDQSELLIVGRKT
ncbi:MAG: hydantoinase/oxoprolinase family protein [Ilumatobacteraceae bacterium]